MFSKKYLTLVISSLLATPTINATEINVDEHLIVTGRNYGYKVDTNSTAMRMEMTQLETPGQIAVIDESLINEQRAITLGQVLQNDASVSAGGTSRNRERFSLRGFELGTGSGYLRDGHQLFSQYRQPMELFERVEVMKGPSGLLYGKSAPGGIINMIAKKPTYDPQIIFSQDIGSNQHLRSILDVSGALDSNQALRGRIVLANETYESWRQYGNGSKPQTERFVGGIFLDYDVSDDLFLSFYYDHTDDQGGVDSGAYIIDGMPVLGREHIWDAQWSNIHNQSENLGFNVTAYLNDMWTLKTGLNYQEFNRHDVESYPKFNNYASAGTIIQGGSDRQDKWRHTTAYMDFTADLDLMNMQHQVLIGANWLGYGYDRYQRSFISHNVKPNESVPTPSIDPNKKIIRSKSNYDAWGFYVQDMMTINDQWQILAGVRFDRQIKSGLAEESVSPKLAAIFHPTENGSIYLSYSENFEPQGVVSGDEYINDGQQLDPLLGKQYELGTKWELMDNRLFASAAIFNITQENSIIDINDSNNPDLKIRTQAGERVHNGAEIAMQGKLTERFNLHASAMYIDAEYTRDAKYQGHRPADVPEFAASAWTSYNITDSTMANIGLYYEGERFGDAANTFIKDAYTRVDIGIAHTYRYSDQLDIRGRLGIENVFDTEYMLGGGSTSSAYPGASGVTLGEGRNYMATIEFKY